MGGACTCGGGLLRPSPRWDGCGEHKRVDGGPSTPAWPFRWCCADTPRAAHLGVRAVVVQTRESLEEAVRPSESGDRGLAKQLHQHQEGATVLHPTFSLPPGKNGSYHGAPTTAGRDFLSKPSPHGRPPMTFFGKGAEMLLLTKLFFFSSAPISSLFSPDSLACQPSPFTCAHHDGQELLPGGSDGGLRRRTSSLHLHNALRSQNRPLNPESRTLLQLYKQHEAFTYSRSRTFDNYIKQPDKFNLFLPPVFIFFFKLGPKYILLCTEK